ncbi:hypothetical protein J7376_17570 [Paracoccus sp. R12_1]|uniref:hypothetical protein n=1 Tax=unclassified Paracoccus (in: a-proteobacteria) TaxID=2688777 RepID=UPI001ADC7B10|nr:MULTISPECIES: hypothetical protein [unclassified Paracoccus (in: a-proteobacteria)]MBO9457074.1 hypothetical protein [Paracoccus sp. R12_2]MBO9488327.1 hypothetical protein [Paracoccus sp. R12_1]
MTQQELMQALAPPRLPSYMAMLTFAEALVLFGIGLLVGLAVWSLLRPLLVRRPSRRTRIRATRDLPPQERLLAIARILGHLPTALRPAAYGAAPPPDPAQIERIARRSRR